MSFIQARRIARQNAQLVALYGDKQQLAEDLKTGQKKVAEADSKIAAAAEKVDAANTKLAKANIQITAAEKDLAHFNAERVTVMAEAKQAAATAALAKAETIKADSRVALLTKELSAIQRALKSAQLDVVRTELDASAAEIRLLTNRGQYADAVRKTESLLFQLQTDKALSELPQTELSKRITEVEARRTQLLKRVNAAQP